MDEFNQITGVIAPMPDANIDTDVIMPKQFLKGIDRAGLDKGVFFDLRFTPDGQLNEDFILNRPGWQNASFLLTGPNFGCGSSREHAVWGLKQLGIRALIGSTFAGIFNDNCQRNGILTLSLDDASVKQLSRIANDPEMNRITVSLTDGEIITQNGVFLFHVSQMVREMLSAGGDAIGWTLKYQQDITRFEKQYFSRSPWLKPQPVTD
ncbi:3-isopropylmalate dehydratase small subunit [Klebsiella pneumoniae]|uniref:3-isopropylmalate dehydratase small subunit n=1 Tax=Klebsiella pneumoniae TaxID=573 RepID=UPI00272F0213|nr:3-isopropylmalate dehydratase small subunit [Klebsiella pneumoniae]MDP1018751.1 3-isopropylmalate dehydratase small subunit [Klebsiella pneumoniae]